MNLQPPILVQGQLPPVQQVQGKAGQISLAEILRDGSRFLELVPGHPRAIFLHPAPAFSENQLTAFPWLSLDC